MHQVNLFAIIITQLLKVLIHLVEVDRPNKRHFFDVYNMLPNAFSHAVFQRAGMLQSIDPGLKDYIHHMVSKGVNFLDEMRPHLVEYIEREFQTIPEKSNRRYWPTDRDIINHMQSAFAMTL